MQILQIENKAAKLRLNETVHKGSMDRLVEEIDRVFGAQAFATGGFTGEITNCIENAADTMDIEIHSPGGSVLDGYTLYNSIMDMRSRGVYVTAYVTLAASMASVIAMAADSVVMLTGSRMMIHEASAGTQGDAEEHRNRAELLEGISNEIAGIYAGRTGIAQDEIRTMMKKETWMDADQAIQAGFADAKFDRPKKDKTMNILDRLTKPSEPEAAERISALEAEIESHANIGADFQAKLDVAEAALQEAATELIEARSAKDTISAELVEVQASLVDLQAKHDALVAEKEAEVESLKADAEAGKEKVDARASELLAEIGHPAPVQLEDDGVAVKSHVETFNTLTGAAATAYYKENRSKIQAEQRALSK